MNFPKCPVCSGLLPKASLMFKPAFVCPTCRSALYTNMRLVSFVESLIGLPVLIVIAWVMDVHGYNESDFEKVLVVLMVPIAVLHYFVLRAFLKIDKSDQPVMAAKQQKADV